MVHIHTKENKKGKWYCFGTVQGYDYSFEDFTIETVRNQMRKLLQKLCVPVMNIKWHEPKTYDEIIKSQPPKQY